MKTQNRRQSSNIKYEIKSKNKHGQTVISLISPKKKTNSDKSKPKYSGDVVESSKKFLSGMDSLQTKKTNRVKHKKDK